MRRKLRPLARREAPCRSLCVAALAAAFLAVGASAQAAPFVYVTNERSKTVSQYEVSAGGLLAPLTPPWVFARADPEAVAVSPDGQSVYVANSGVDNVTQYDVGPGGRLAPKSPATVAAGDGPFGVAVSPDGQSVYVSNAGGDNLSQYDVGAGGLLSPKSPATVAGGDGPFGVAVSPDGQSVYVADAAGHSVSQYDVGAGGLLLPKSPATVVAGSAFTVAVSPDGQSVYVPDDNGNKVFQYDVGAGGVLSPKSPATVAGGEGSFGVAVSPDGKSVYVTNAFGASVSQYDVGLGGGLAPKSPATVPAGIEPLGLAVSTDGQSVYAANTAGNSDNVSQYDVGVGGLLAPLMPPTVAAGDGPDAVAVSPLRDPETFITGGASGATNDPTPTFTFSGSELRYQCKLDSGVFSACSSPKTTSHLTDGPHTFYVRAKDSQGNVDPTPASRTVTVRTASVRVSGSALVINAAPGAKDNLQITRPSASIVRVTDSPAGAYAGSGVHTGAGCTRSGDYTANCLASAITPALPALVTSAGQQGDRVVNSTNLPSSLYGGGGNDVLIGGSDRDILNGGTGADLLSGLGGNDLLGAHDGASDQSIDCGLGTDKADLDLLPLDANVQGCETKTRH